MSFCIVSEDNDGGCRAIIVPEMALAFHVARKVLDERNKLVAIVSRGGEYPLSVDEVVQSHANRAHYAKLCEAGRRNYGLEDVAYEQELKRSGAHWFPVSRKSN